MTDGFLMFIDVIALAYGVYMLYTWFKLHSTGKLFPSGILIPNGLSPTDCDDAEGYIQYMKPKILILGILVTVYGAVCLANESLQFIPWQGSLALTAVVFLVIVWYGICNYKANKLYW